ncbi:isochorismatase family protein [Actinocorallia sp. API 0066]|uniref:isochorismatase family protein n=1 Tax=Actinocorallia sp. API 0066 TaxID=2896846 RepID=UPI001E2A72BE|nr:isochorismatase family protein [Actinocorallia sp. API 0066]MCD0453686.1 isochorismatase family protein [Actinocorallia sp. API 0066]
MTRAHLIIDVQESFRALPSWGAISDPEIAKSVGRLVDGARERGELVVWVLHAVPGLGPFDPASGLVKLLDGLEVREGEPVVHKSAHNAFTTTGLQRLLTQFGVTEVSVSGIRAEQCVETTARVAADLGFGVLFVRDAVATHPLGAPGGPVERSAEDLLADPEALPAAEVIRRTEYALSGRFARIVTVDEALD